MKELSFYFKKFKKIKPPEKTKKKIIQYTIMKKTGISISLDNIIVKNTSVELINIPSVIKNEIKFKSKDIIKELSKDNINILYIV